jgi:hypothetical protein
VVGRSEDVRHPLIYESWNPKAWVLSPLSSLYDIVEGSVQEISSVPFILSPTDDTLEPKAFEGEMFKGFKPLCTG